MSKLLIALLSFILGGSLGFVITYCILLEKDELYKGEKYNNEKNIRKIKND